MSTWTRRARLFVRRRAFLLDLGEEVLFYTEGGPRRARYLLVGRVSPPEWLRLGLPREAVLHYPLGGGDPGPARASGLPGRPP